MGYEQPRIVNLYPVGDVYALYQMDDGGFIAEKVPFLGLCEDGQIVPMSYSYELSSCCECQNFQAYGTKESLEGEFRSAKIDFLGDAKKPILRNNDDFQCELNECPTCGHIVEGVENGERFNYCPGCGQAIDWRVT